MQAPEQQQGGGTKRIIGILGDALLGAAGRPGMYAPMMMRRNEQDRAQQQALAAEQRALANQKELLGYKAGLEGPKGPNIGTFDDNAGNVWTYDKATGQIIGDKPMFVDTAPKYYVQGDKAVQIGNPFSGGDLPVVTDQASYEAIPPGQQYRDPQGNLRTKGGTSGNAGGGF